MLNIKNISLTKDGGLTRLNLSWDEINEHGKTVSMNNRASRIITDETALEHVTAIESLAELIIEEEG